jgi:hypothetical protein
MERFDEIKNKNYYRIPVPEKHCINNIWLLKPMGLNCGISFYIII